MVELLEMLSYGAFILAVVALALAVVFFFAFNIKEAIGELSGKTATTAIAKMREQGASRKYKGRSLQSIVLEDGADTGDFSFEKLALGVEGAPGAKDAQKTSAAQEAHTSLIAE